MKSQSLVVANIYNKNLENALHNITEFSKTTVANEEFEIICKCRSAVIGIDKYIVESMFTFNHKRVYKVTGVIGLFTCNELLVEFKKRGWVL